MRWRSGSWQHPCYVSAGSSGCSPGTVWIDVTRREALTCLSSQIGVTVCSTVGHVPLPAPPCCVRAAALTLLAVVRESQARCVSTKVHQDVTGTAAPGSRRDPLSAPFHHAGHWDCVLPALWFPFLRDLVSAVPFPGDNSHPLRGAQLPPLHQRRYRGRDPPALRLAPLHRPPLGPPLPGGPRLLEPLPELPLRAPPLPVLVPLQPAAQPPRELRPPPSDLRVLFGELCNPRKCLHRLYHVGSGPHAPDVHPLEND
ncbi:post-GPI attachment to proteins factor 2 isoform X3 [Athene cunicularia]|uniref:post-GPI attachment to proteins factor 2 isoform X3 n=1 Tax=Athene cunicularia TaxID=194338 RepID=UPI000EF6D5DF|nr:post-GPI attachment to proteins factor 2 isoform X3 [Athene cunicularia]